MRSKTIIGLLQLLLLLLLTSAMMSIDLKVSRYQQINEYDFLEMLQEKFAENVRYNETTYNCQDIAYDFKGILDLLGYESTYTGGYNNSTGHMWNSVSFEIDAAKKSNTIEQYRFEYTEEYLTNLLEERYK